MFNYYRSTELLQKDKEFYLNLGFTKEQAEKLSKRAFGVDYTDERKGYNGRLEGTVCLNNIGGIQPMSVNYPVAKRASANIRGNGIFNSRPTILERKVTNMDGSVSAVNSVSSANISNDASVFCCMSAEEEVGLFAEDSEKPSIYDLMNRENSAIVNEKGFRNVLSSPTSTFSSTVNTASMSIVREKLLLVKDSYSKLDGSAVRIEELLNFFEYNLSTPKTRIFNINTELCEKPNSNHKYLFVGLKGKEVEVPNQNIVFLVDVSGSMSSRVIDVQKSVMTILKNLKDTDTVSLVTYSNTDHVIFEGLKANDIDTIIDKLYTVEFGGCTYGSKGIKMAYSLADKYFITGGSNRVIMATDGDFNFGLTKKTDLKTFISEKKNVGCFLTMLGYGYGNYQDENMETLAKNGNGNYFKISDDFDITETLKKKINSTLVAIAKDVKIQVEFNPNVVKSYRLLGYENRALNHEDFKNDKVAAEPVGSGHTVVAVYELEFVDGKNSESDLKYQKVVVNDSDAVCTVSVRYKLPEEDKSEELSVEVKNNVKDMSDNLKIAYATIVLGERLRKSDYYEKGSLQDALKIIDNLHGEKVDMLKDLLKSCE